jgi:hypothetical protein
MIYRHNDLGFGAFSDVEIARFNRAHDRDYGWGFDCVMAYSNPLRISGNVIAPPGFDKAVLPSEDLTEQVWEWHNRPQ